MTDHPIQQYDDLIRSAAQRLRGHQRRLFQAEVVNALCGGSPRAAERRFGWGRDCVETGLHEASSGIRCVENFAAKGAAVSYRKFAVRDEKRNAARGFHLGRAPDKRGCQFPDVDQQVLGGWRRAGAEIVATPSDAGRWGQEGHVGW